MNGAGISFLRVMGSEKPKSRSRSLRTWFKRKHKRADSYDLREFSGLLFLLLFCRLNFVIILFTLVWGSVLQTGVKMKKTITPAIFLSGLLRWNHAAY